MMNDKQSQLATESRKLFPESPATVGKHRKVGRSTCWLLGAALLALCPLAASARTDHQGPSVLRLGHPATGAVAHRKVDRLAQGGQQAFGPFIWGTGRQAAAGPVPAGAVWQAVGPNGYLGATQRTYQGTEAINGRVNDAVFDPKNAGAYYIATGAGGVWRTTDAGKTWTPLTEKQDTLSTACITMDPTNSDVLYVGTGDFQGTEGLTVGLLKTTNASAASPTWTAVGTSSFGNFRVSRILVDPDSPQTITVSTGRGHNGAGSFGQVWRSTDGGATWTVVIPNPVEWSDLSMGAAMPDGRRVYYAAGFLDTGQRVIWRSVDRGASWVQVYTSGIIKAGNDPDTTSLSYVGASRTNPAVVYAIISSTGSVTVMRSVDMGDTWANITGNFPSVKDNFRQAWFNVALTVSTAPGPTGAPQDILYVSGLDVTRGRVASDGTVTWNSPGQTLTDNAIFHCDQHFAAVNPANPNQLLLCCDGGVYNLLYNPADDSSQITGLNQNLGVAQFYNGAYHPTNANYLLGGTQDNGSVEARGDITSWVQVGGGDGGYCTLNPMNPMNQLVSGPQLEFVRITNDAFMTNTELDPMKGTDQVRFIAPIVLDPTRPTIDYYGSNFLNSIDTTSGVIVRRIGNQQLSQNGKISAIAVAPSDGTRIYTGSTQGELWMSSDRGMTWTQINAAGGAGLTGLPMGEINFILVNPTDPNMIYVAVGGSGVNGVYATTSTTAGAARTFTQMNGSGTSALPGLAVNTLAFDFRDTSLKTIFAGTDGGVYATTDGGATWTDATRPFGLPRVKVTDLKAISGTGFLMAATLGRGFWRLPLTTAAAQRSVSRQAASGSPLHVGAVAGNGKVDLSFNAVAGATGYQIKRSNTPGGPYTPLSTVNTTSFEDTGLTNETNYYYVVTALQGTAAITTSDEVSSQPVAIPAPPKNLVAQGGDKMVTVSWEPSPTAAFYTVSRTTNPSGDDMDVVGDNITAQNFVDTDVVNGQTYFYHVAATNAQERNSDPGGETVAVTPGGTTDSLGGTVSSVNNATAIPLPGMQVRLQYVNPQGNTGDLPVGQEADTVSQPALQTITDAAGHFSFGNLSDGPYTVQVAPTAGQTAVPPLTRMLDFHVNNGQVNDANFTLAPPGNFTQGLTMISVPYDYTGTTIDSGVAIGLMPASAGGPLPIATYNPVNNNYLYYPNLPGGNGNQTQPGRGYWVFKTSNAPLTMPGKPVASPFTLTLSPGWNEIGDPFTTPVNIQNLVFSFPFAVDDLRANDPISQEDAVASGIIGNMVFAYDPTQNKYVPVDTLQPFQGYWIYLSPTLANGQPATVTFRNDSNQ